MEGLDKVTFIIETAGNGGFFYGNIFGGQHFAGTFDAVIIQVINGCPFCHAAKITAKVSGVHAGDPGQLIQGDIAGVVFCNVGQNILDGGKTLGRGDISGAFFVQMFR